ncbi:A disintegrin and metalloproteinase with thrombospondin motifs 8 isoform X2 [Neodiprion fabricii]|uniref:A disintegrin and metalloproteinase with thrombospondin motifs 8 isoform X2 n=1 Tax=Neodiprion fabricii TaxID=2872261 RepID=UPI001ED91033|nr:A disintegrin and metalloproteinase with thrombospondin motifs 8 isoform X2 [Neodiprion fabricii]
MTLVENGLTWRTRIGIFLYIMLCTLVLLCMVSQTLAQGYNIHKHMTTEEMLSVFHTEQQDLVPEYEVIPIRHTLPKRSINSEPELELQAFGKNYNLSLKPTRGLLPAKDLPIWTVEKNSSQPDGLHYVDVSEGSVDIGDIYQDRSNMASILLRRDENGKVLVEGNIGSELVIRPLPKRILKDVVRNSQDSQHGKSKQDDVTRTKRNLKHTHHHVIYKRSQPLQDDDYSDFAFMEPDRLGKRFRSKRSIGSRSKREAPYAIFPEILCIVDYDGYRLHGGDNVQIKRYFVSFWNGVDLRYKLLKGPKIRISIAGIIISRGRDATPYLEQNRVGRDAIDSAAALTDMGKYLFRERRLPVYDIAVAVTKYDMCRRRKGGRCTKGTAGFAYVGGACVVNKRLEKVNSVAIIEDTGGFSGIIVAAHEVGHLLGAVHDGSPPPSYLGGPGAEKCRWEDGYIMSDLRHTEKGFKWSHCSVSSFHHFLNGDTATCLFNAPHEDEALPRVLPGKLLSLDAQCRKDRGTSACFKDDRVCAQLFCFDAGSGYCVAYRPAAEGSPCGDGQYCLNGRCVAEHENIIPDYTQNVPTYIRRENVYNTEPQSRTIYSNYNTTENRYQWDSTTRSSLPQKYNFSPELPNVYTFTSTNNPFKYSYLFTSPTTTTTTRLRAPETQATPEVFSKYTQKIAENLLTDVELPKKTYGYSTYSTINLFPATRTTIIPPAVKNYNSQNDLNYPNFTPFEYKNSFPSTTFGNIGAFNGQLIHSRETSGDECIDSGGDCAELIDRLRTWLCHLQSVKKRCCASLKVLCAT